MIVLGIETATSEVGAALVGERGLLAEARARPGRRHVETLHPAIEAACALAGVELSAVEAVAVDVGPGLFTGLRVGIAAAKAIAFGLGVPALGVTSTEALLFAHKEARPLVAVVDLRRGELAWQCDADEGPAALRHGAPDELYGELAAAPGGGRRAVGDGAHAHRAELSALGVPLVEGESALAPAASAVAALGRARAVAGAGGDPFALEACYLRPADARVNYVTRDGPAVVAVPGGRR